MAISLGAVFGGPGNTVASNVWRTMAQAFEASRTVERPFLNVVFHFPGSVLKPEHVGLRTGRFSKKEQGFQIQVAVPEVVAKSTDPKEICTYMLQAIREALVLSEARWSKHGIAFDFESANQSIQKIASQAAVAVVT